MKDIFYSISSVASSSIIVWLTPQLAKVSSHVSAEWLHRWAEVQLWLCAFRYGRALLHLVCAIRKAGCGSGVHWAGILREWRHQ